MQLSTSRLAEVLSAIRASPLALHLARSPVRGTAGRLRPVCSALVEHPQALVTAYPPDHEPTLAVRDLYDTHLKMCGMLEAFADLRGDHFA